MDDWDFYFEKERLERDQWLKIFSERKYNEEVCVFRDNGEEYMLIITKPVIEYKNTSKDYMVHFYPVAGAKDEELDPDDLTYAEIMSWMYDGVDEWDSRALDYIDDFAIFDEIDKSLKQHPKFRIFTVNKYEDLRSYKKEDDRHKEFPCKFHWFYAKFSKYDIRLVRSMHIEMFFEKTGLRREFFYTFDEFLDFFVQDEKLWEDALVHSIKDFYSNHDNLSSYFRVLTVDTTVCKMKIDQHEKSVQLKVGNAMITITFPHIEDSQFEKNGDSIKVFTHDYVNIFGIVCGSQTRILQLLEDYIPKIDWRKKLGEFYYPY